MPDFRMAFALLAVIAVVGVARGEPEGAPAPGGARGEDGLYAIGPGQESLFSDMLGSGQTLPGGCTMGDGRIDRSSVVVTYDCGSGQVVLRLVHPADAPGG